jgi:hypothetical protein
MYVLYVCTYYILLYEYESSFFLFCPDLQHGSLMGADVGSAQCNPSVCRRVISISNYLLKLTLECRWKLSQI